ncbi:hypothetical protein [Ammoniphilus resinae]|uniref:Uncharacterized protein n=1 Tax=Ammoniphilus resinae TaxID=861532 RepID=A0ABS4GT39_9BACL|nr:hypothetical protein [Ammoniphilus resinae]MBP1933450.1 hypothetical protein [Ammoniphilus resinae]
MLFKFLLITLMCYTFYKHGTKFMLKARLFSDARADLAGYGMFLIAGTILGNFIGIIAASYYTPGQTLFAICSSTLSSILIGELFYHYNKKLIRRIPTVQERKNC